MSEHATEWAPVSPCKDCHRLAYAPSLSHFCGKLVRRNPRCRPSLSIVEVRESAPAWCPGAETKVNHTATELERDNWKEIALSLIESHMEQFR